MKLVVIESPFAGDVEKNVRYAKACLLHSLRLGEAPIASHLLYPQVLDDLVNVERAQGIMAGLAWAAKADFVAYYVDLGWSPGMLAAEAGHRAGGREGSIRTIYGNGWYGDGWKR